MVRALSGARPTAAALNDASAVSGRTSRERGRQRLSRLLNRLVSEAVSSACAALAIEPRRTDMAKLVQTVLARARAEHPRRWLTDASAGNGRGRWDPERIELLLATMLEFVMSDGDVAAPVSVVWLADAATVVVEIENESFPSIERHRSKADDLPGSAAHWVELLLARGVAHAHGGELDVREGATGGIVVVLTLPRNAGAPRAPLRPGASAAPGVELGSAPSTPS
jgi:hypothetical protein